MLGYSVAILLEKECIVTIQESVTILQKKNVMWRIWNDFHRILGWWPTSIAWESAILPSFIAFLYSILSTLQFGIKKNHVCLRKVCLWSAQKRPNGRHCSTETQCAELQHKSLLMAKVLSRDRALSFPFTSFICTIVSTLQFGIKKNHICLRKVCLWSVQRRPNGCHSVTVRWATA